MNKNKWVNRKKKKKNEEYVQVTFHLKKSFF